MSGLELNKIAAAILIAALILLLTSLFANMLYKPVLKPQERGYQVALDDDANSNQSQSDSSKDAKKEVNIEELMANANAELGAKVTKKCVACHSFNKGGKNKVGPNLWNIYNNKHGHLENFAYSNAIKSIKSKWTEKELFHFLHKPSKYASGTKMSFAGLRKDTDIANVIAYLKTLKD